MKNLLFYVIILMLKKELIQMNENKTNINCLITISATPLGKYYK